MSSKEEIQKQCVEKVFNERYNMHLDSDDIRKAFNIGWGAAIDKACEWLKENSGYYVEHWDGDTWINSKLYEDFRRAMEE